MRPGEALYRIDARDELVFVNAGWDAFAIENEGEHLAGARVFGRALWSFISDTKTEEIYRELARRVRGGRSVELEFRCDSPGTKRRHAMHMSRFGEDVVFRVEVLSLERRPFVDLRWIPGDGSPVGMCSWCKQVEHDGSWLELPRAVALRKAFERRSRLSHGICPSCERELEEMLEDA